MSSWYDVLVLCRNHCHYISKKLCDSVSEENRSQCSKVILCSCRIQVLCLKGICYNYELNQLYKCWCFAAEYFPDRSEVQCLHRWQKVLNPELIKGPWTLEVCTASPSTL